MEKRDTPAWKFFDRHLQWFFDNDIDGMVENDYTEDATLVSPLFTVKGREALRAVFRDYVEMVGDMQLKSVETFMEGDDHILIEATMETAKAGERKVYDAWVMRDGKIAYHFTGVR